MACVPWLNGWVPSLWSSCSGPRWPTLKGKTVWMGLQIHEIQVLSPAARVQPQCFRMEWTGETQLPSLLFCPSSNGNLRPHGLPSPSLPNPQLSRRLPCHLGKKYFCSNCFWVCKQCALQPNSKGEGRLREGSQVLWLSLSTLSIARQPWSHLCASSLSTSLVSAAAYTVHSFRNTHWISLLLPAEGSAIHNAIPLPSLLSPAMICRTASLTPLSSSPFLLPLFPPTCPPLDLSLPVSLRCVCELSRKSFVEV